MGYRLIEADWPDTGAPAPPPLLSRAELAARLASTRAAMAARGLDMLVVYGDREHFANLRWLSGFDPRFEEALLFVPGAGAPLLAVGNECLSYTAISPAVAAGDIGTVLCPSLSLVSQPREGARLDAVVAGAVPAGARVGTVGWKYWEAGEVDDPATALEIPAIIADLLRARAGRVENATDLFMHPDHGLRCSVTADDVARMEFAGHMAAAALGRMVFALRPGMRDFEAVEAARLGGLPLGCHVTFATGAKARLGLTGPTGETLARGDFASFNVCHWGANSCRAGWLVAEAAELPAELCGTVDEFVAPYLAALSRWFALMTPGTPGGAVAAEMAQALPHERFGIALNPGHLIGDDEWVSSPIFPGSEIALRSGMAMQCDLIPDHPLHATTRMEDGYVIADAAFRDEIAGRHPALMRRVAARQRFMREVAGLDLPDSLLPLADSCGVLAPFLLAPRRLLVLGG